MTQKQKLGIGLVVIAVLILAAGLAYFWSTGKIDIGASTEPPVMSPTSLTVATGQIVPVDVTGGSLPYGGYISDDPTVAEIESWYSYNVASSTTTPALTLVVKGISAGSTNIQLWDQDGNIQKLPVTVSEITESKVNTSVSFVTTSLKLNIGKQCESVIEATSGASNFWTDAIVSDPEIATISRFGGVSVSGETKTALRVYGLKAGTNTMLVRNAADQYAQLNLEVVESGGTCEEIALLGNMSNTTITTNTTFTPATPPTLIEGQSLAVKTTSANKLGGFVVDKPSILALDSWNAIGSDQTNTNMIFKGVSAGTANVYVWDQQSSVSKYTVTVAAPGEVNTGVAFSPATANVALGEQSDLIVDLNDQASQWVSMVAGDSSVATPVRFGLVQNGDQVDLALRVYGASVGSTYFTLIHKDGSLARVDVAVTSGGGDDDDDVTDDDVTDDDTTACETGEFKFAYTPNAWNIKTYNFAPASESMQIYNVFGFLGAEKPVSAYTYPGTGLAYEENGTPAIGEGFWFLSGATSPACIPADRAVATTQTTAPINGSIAMVGNPTQSAVKWSDVTITANGSTSSILDASNQSSPIVKAIFTYQPGAEEYIGYYAGAYTDYINNGGNAMSDLMGKSIEPGNGVWIILNSKITSATLNF